MRPKPRAPTWRDPYPSHPLPSESARTSRRVIEEQICVVKTAGCASLSRIPVEDSCLQVKSGIIAFAKMRDARTRKEENILHRGASLVHQLIDHKSFYREVRKSS